MANVSANKKKPKSMCHKSKAIGVRKKNTQNVVYNNAQINWK